MTLTFHNPPAAPAPVGLYSNLAEIDLGRTRMLVLSGQIALDGSGELVGGDDLAAQSERVFEIIGALLASRGAGFADVVNIRTYLTDIGRLAEYGAVRKRYFAEPLPTSTTVEVPRLFRPGALLEVDVTAVLDENKSHNAHQ